MSEDQCTGCGRGSRLRVSRSRGSRRRCRARQLPLDRVCHSTATRNLAAMSPSGSWLVQVPVRAHREDACDSIARSSVSVAIDAREVARQASPMPSLPSVEIADADGHPLPACRDRTYENSSPDCLSAPRIVPCREMGSVGRNFWLSFFEATAKGSGSTMNITLWRIVLSLVLS
jgi:hypothetical protein